MPVSIRKLKTNNKIVKTVTIVVAVVNDQELGQARKCLTSIDTDRFEVIVTYPAKYHKSIEGALGAKNKFSMKICNQTSVRGLWQHGGGSAITPWLVFIQSSDLLTAQLQNNIDQRCRKLPPHQDYKYNLPRISIFLKRRTKYCHFWTGEPLPHIKFNYSSHAVKTDFKVQGSEEFWAAPMGSLIHYGPETISKAIATATSFVEEWAENVYCRFPDLDKKVIFRKAAKESLINFFGGLLFKKWIRDGYEGFIFALLDLFITCFGYLRYHEKYIRSGRQLASQLDSIQNILLVHVNGIGDVVMATPTLKNMKARLPKAKIDVITYAPAKAVIKNNPYVNHIFTVPRFPSKNELRQLVKNLKSCKYDLIINLMSRNSTEKLVGRLTGKWRINDSVLYRERFTDVMLGFKNDESSFIQRELDFLKQIGFEPKKNDPEIFLTNR